MLSLGFSRISTIPSPTKTTKSTARYPFQRKLSSMVVSSSSLAPHGVICHAKPLRVDAPSSDIEVHFEMTEKEKGEKSATEIMREGLKAELMPKHVAVIVDTDDQRRWAKARDFPIELGYVSCGRPVEGVIRLCCELGIKFLSVHVFSTESFQLPQEEVDFAMNLIEATMTTTMEDFMRDGIRVSVTGNKLEELPKPVQDSITLVEETTKDNTKLHLLASINNEGLSNLTQACKILADNVKKGIIQPEDIDETLLRQQFDQTNYYSDHLPDADLLIRASGTSSKLANFMTWQSAYSEIIFVEKFISDFKEADFVHVLDGFQKRREHFGGHK